MLDRVATGTRCSAGTAETRAPVCSASVSIGHETPSEHCRAMLTTGMPSQDETGAISQTRTECSSSAEASQPTSAGEAASDVSAITNDDVLVQAETSNSTIHLISDAREDTAEGGTPSEQYDDGQSSNETVENHSSFSKKDGILQSPGRALKRRLASREPVRYWTEEEHRLFLAGVSKFGGRNYKALAEHIQTRTPTQVRTHLQKYLVKLQKVKRLKAEAENIKQQLGIGVNPEILTAVGIGSMPVSADPVLSAAAGLKDLASPPLAKQEQVDVKAEPRTSGQRSDVRMEVDEVLLVEVFEEMANESKTNDGHHGCNKNCHFCGHEPKRFGTIACCVPACGQRFCEHCLMKHMSDEEKPGTMEEADWTCPICRRVCCCVHASCSRNHRHCKRFRRARWRQQSGGAEQPEVDSTDLAPETPSQAKTAVKAKGSGKKAKVDNADVCLLLDFCHSGA